jgi:phage FluMu gp28-like protein
VVLTVARRNPTPSELRDWLATVPGFLQGLTSVDDRQTLLYDYQVRMMTEPSRFRSVLKSRQTGLSFTYAAEALAKAHLKPDHTSIFVSYNLDDAKEKIRQAALLYESLPLAYRKRLVTENKTELEFADSRGHRSRLVSMPCREPRGKGRADVHLDELPFMRDSRRIYAAAVPIISRGGGSLTLGSTPLGKQDLFYEISEGDADQYPQFARYRIAWWDCPEFCTDVPTARRLAPNMTSAERVERFGTPTIKVIFQSMDSETFQQEYELTFIDSMTAYIPWDLIVAASRDDDELQVASSVEEFLTIDTQGPLFAGYDVGRTRDLSELIVVEQRGDRFQMRLLQTLAQAPFALQEANLLQLLAQRPDVRRLCVDQSGLGMQLAENVVTRYPGRAEGVTFTAPVKSVLAGDLKILLERRGLLIPANRDLMLQLHSVKKIVTKAGNVRLDTDRSEKHHADKFWSLALGVHAAGLAPIINEYVELVDDDDHVQIGADF